MNCRQARLYGADRPEEMPPGLRRSILEHIERCPSCREAAERSRAVAALIALKRHEVPEPGYMDGFLDRFRRRLRMERTMSVRAPRGRWSWLWAEPAVVLRTAFATLLLVLAVGRIVTVGMRSGQGAGFAEGPASPEFQAVSVPWLGDGGAARANLGSGPIIIIRPEDRRLAEPRHYLRERRPVVPVSYEF